MEDDLLDMLRYIWEDISFLFYNKNKKKYITELKKSKTNEVKKFDSQIKNK